MNETTYEGVGRIWKEDGLWHWETIHGDTGKPFKQREHAKNAMDTSWAKKNKEIAGVYWHSQPSCVLEDRKLNGHRAHILTRKWCMSKWTQAWHPKEMCLVGTIRCVYQGNWTDEPDKVRVMLPGHTQPWKRSQEGWGYTVEQLKLMGYKVRGPVFQRLGG